MYFNFSMFKMSATLKGTTLLFVFLKGFVTCALKLKNHNCVNAFFPALLQTSVFKALYLLTLHTYVHLFCRYCIYRNLPKHECAKNSYFSSTGCSGSSDGRRIRLLEVTVSLCYHLKLRNRH